MVGMTEIDILDVGMKNGNTYVLEFDVFSMLLGWKIIHIF